MSVTGDSEMRDELGSELPKDIGRFILVDFYENDCHTTFSGNWDGKMIKAALRSIEHQYKATKHMVTRQAAEARMKLVVASSQTSEGSEDGRQ